jgi:hypothetical protein
VPTKKVKKSLWRSLVLVRTKSFVGINQYAHSSKLAMVSRTHSSSGYPFLMLPEDIVEGIKVCPMAGCTIGKAWQ